MRTLALMALALLAGCGRPKYRFVVHAEERPYIDAFFDPDGLAKVECGRLTQFREVFYLRGERVTRRRYFEALQEEIGMKIAARCAKFKATRPQDRNAVLRTEAANDRAMEFWQSMKARRDDPDAELEAYRRRKESVL